MISREIILSGAVLLFRTWWEYRVHKDISNKGKTQHMDITNHQKHNGIIVQVNRGQCHPQERRIDGYLGGGG